MDEAAGNPLRDALESALAAVDGVPLAGGDQGVTVGVGEFELRLDWPAVQAALGDARSLGWADRIAEFLLAQVAAGRRESADWSHLAGRALPLILSQENGRSLAQRAADVLAYPYAEVLLISIVVPFDGGLRYLLMRDLARWRVSGEEVIGRAIGNLRAVSSPDCLEALDEDCWVVDSGDGFDASRLLILDELLPEAASCGALAAAPAREVLAFAPFRQSGCRNLRRLVNLAERGFHRWPNPISDSLFYVAPRIALELAVGRDDEGHPTIRLPRVLADIQAELVESGRW